MQTEMEHATGYLSSRLAEHESLSEQAQHQVTLLLVAIATVINISYANQTLTV